MYVVDSGDVHDDVERLPAEAAAAFAAFRAAVAVSPWTVAPSINPDKDEAPVRLHLLRSEAGSALISYLIREHDRRVDLLQIAWLG
jgi:hypothetical protein